MNADECVTVQRLVSSLDHSSHFYRILKRQLCDAHARFLVSKMIALSSTAADDLAERMLLTGGLAARRGGGALTRLQAHAACWMAVASAKRDTACLKRIVRHGDRITQRFQAVMAQVRDLHPGLHRHLSELERIRFRVESLERETQAWPPTDDPYPARVAAELLKHGRFQR